jgi:tRNA threonylcarbamoyladenosine biosynthesis protein TsaB
MPAALLAFDSATEHLAVALRARGGTWLADLPGGPAASRTLLPAVARLLGEAGLTFAELDAIGFGRGPGAFTGLRTACSVAQGLAFAHDLPVLPIDTLLVVAEEVRQADTSLAEALDIWILQDARMGEIYGARYRWDGVRWHADQVPQLWNPASWAAAQAADPAPHVAGSALGAYGDALSSGAARRHAARVPTARALAHLAGLAWASGSGVPAEAAVPLYVRDRVALTTAERAAAQVAAVVPLSGV